MNDDRRLLLLGMHAVIYDKNLKPESLYVYDMSSKSRGHSEIGEEMSMFEPICSRQGYSHSGNDFLIGFKCYEIKKDLLEKNVYQGCHTFNSLIVQLSFPDSEKAVNPLDMSNSILLKNELVTSLFKIDENQIIASTYHN